MSLWQLQKCVRTTGAHLSTDTLQLSISYLSKQNKNSKKHTDREQAGGHTSRAAARLPGSPLLAFPSCCFSKTGKGQLEASCHRPPRKSPAVHTLLLLSPRPEHELSPCFVFLAAVWWWYREHILKDVSEWTTEGGQHLGPVRFSLG